MYLRQISLAWSHFANGNCLNSYLIFRWPFPSISRKPAHRRVNITFIMPIRFKWSWNCGIMKSVSSTRRSANTVYTRIQICYSIISGYCLFTGFSMVLSVHMQSPNKLAHILCRHCIRRPTASINFSTDKSFVYLHSGFKCFANGKMIRWIGTDANHWWHGGLACLNRTRINK